jgi:hypothetical protein
MPLSLGEVRLMPLPATSSVTSLPASLRTLSESRIVSLTDESPAGRSASSAVSMVLPASPPPIPEEPGLKMFEPVPLMAANCTSLPSRSKPLPPPMSGIPAGVPGFFAPL